MHTHTLTHAHAHTYTHKHTSSVNNVGYEKDKGNAIDLYTNTYTQTHTHTHSHAHSLSNAGDEEDRGDLIDDVAEFQDLDDIYRDFDDLVNLSVLYKYQVTHIYI